MLFAEGLPIGFIPEELLRYYYRFLASAVQRFFKPVRPNVVNDRSRNGPALSVAHHAQRVRPQERQSGFIPATAIDARLFHIHSPGSRLKDSLWCGYEAHKKATSGCQGLIYE